jgi:thioredoxin-related protein
MPPVRLIVLCAVALVAWTGVQASETAQRPDGLHYEPWIKNLSFLDLAEDLAEARAAGKGLVLLFEAPGCGSCKKLHEVNFKDPDLVAYIRTHFDVVQINLFGDKTATTITGADTSEKALAQEFMVHFTPSTVFLTDDGTEAFRVHGYLPARFYKDAFEYVVDRAYERGILFPRWRMERKAATGS